MISKVLERSIPKSETHRIFYFVKYATGDIIPLEVRFVACAGMNKSTHFMP